MSEEYVTRPEYSADLKRIEDENNRQNHRIDRLEDVFNKITELTTSVHELAITMSAMQKEQERQGKRLDQIEAEPADAWKKFKWIIVSVIVTAVLTYLLTKGGI